MSLAKTASRLDRIDNRIEKKVYEKSAHVGALFYRGASIAL
jgi:hypothetical protein